MNTVGDGLMTSMTRKKNALQAFRCPGSILPDTSPLSGLVNASTSRSDRSSIIRSTSRAMKVVARPRSQSETSRRTRTAGAPNSTRESGTATQMGNLSRTKAESPLRIALHYLAFSIQGAG